MVAIGVIPAEALDGYAGIGELALDGSQPPVAGVLPAAIAATTRADGAWSARPLRTGGGVGLGRSDSAGGAVAR